VARKLLFDMSDVASEIARPPPISAVQKVSGADAAKVANA
jgi:hypothetical protein